MSVSPAADPLDSGPRARDRVERRCALTREALPTTAMIRFVVGPDDTVVPDIRQRLPGRGLWITATRGRLTEAVRRKVFAKGFKRQVTVPETLVATTETLLRAGLADALGIAAKAGAVATGFAKVEEALRRDSVAALIEASDAAPDGVRKIRQAARRAGIVCAGPDPGTAPAGAETDNPETDNPMSIPVIALFSSANLDLVLGRLNVIHAALLAGTASPTVLTRWRRLVRFLEADTSSAGSAPEAFDAVRE